MGGGRKFRIPVLTGLAIGTFALLALTALPHRSYAAGQGLTKDDVMQLHSETKSKLTEVLDKTKDFVAKPKEWAEKLMEWSAKFDSLSAELQKTYEDTADKTARDLQVVALLEKYQDPATLGPLKINLKADWQKNQRMGELLASVSYAKKRIDDKAQSINEYVGNLASKLKITEDTLKDAGEYLKTAKTASEIYDAFKPDEDNTYKGLESIAKILKLGKDYMPPPLDTAIGAYADAIPQIVSGLKALDKKIQENRSQGYLNTGGAFVEAYRAKYKNDPTGFFKCTEFTEVEPSEVYRDEVDTGQPVYSLENGQVEEFGCSYGQATTVYAHYLKILPLIREKTKTQVKVPLARFRKACAASSFGDSVDQTAGLLQKDLKDSPGEAAYVVSFMNEFLEGSDAGKMKAVLAGERIDSEGKLSDDVRRSLSGSDSELSSVRDAGHDALNAALAFQDDVDVQDLAAKAADVSKTSRARIDAAIIKLNAARQTLTGAAYTENTAMVARWVELTGFFTGLAAAPSGLDAEMVGANKSKVDRFNYAIKGKYRDEIAKAAAMGKVGNLSSNIPNGPMPTNDADMFRKAQSILALKDRFGPLMNVADGKGQMPLLNEYIDGILKQIDNTSAEIPPVKTWLGSWKAGLNKEYADYKSEAESRLGASRRAKEEIESKYGFKITSPASDPSVVDASIRSYLSALDGQKKPIDNFAVDLSAWLADWDSKGGSLRGALQKARAANDASQTEMDALAKEKDVTGRATRKYLKTLYEQLDQIRSYNIGLSPAERIVQDGQAKIAEINAKRQEFTRRLAALSKKAETVPFAYPYGLDSLDRESVLRWMSLGSTGDYSQIESVEPYLYQVKGELTTRRYGQKVSDANMAEARRKAEEASGKAPYAEVPLSSIRVNLKSAASGSVTIGPKDLTDRGELVIEGSLTNVRNGAVDYLSYTVNDVDYGREIKGGNPWKHVVTLSDLPGYDKLVISLRAHIGDTWSKPAVFTIHYEGKRPSAQTPSMKMASLLQDTQLTFRVAKARDLARAMTIIADYFKVSVSKNDITYAKNLYLAALDKRDESAANKKEADDIYADLAGEGSATSDQTDGYRKVSDSDFGVREKVSAMQTVLNNYVPDLANLKAASGNTGQDFNINDVLAGRGPQAGGGGTSVGSTSDWPQNSDFDFSAGGTTTDINQSDIFYTPGGSAFPRNGKGAIRDMGTSDFSTAPTMTADGSEVTLTAGHFYAVLTLEGNYAKFKVNSVTGATANITWRYQPNGSTSF